MKEQEMAATLTTSLVANANRLGLTWQIRFGVVTQLRADVTYVELDGDNSGESDDVTQVIAVPLGPQPATRSRVTCFLTSPTEVYIIGMSPYAGQPVMRWRNSGGQSIPDAGAGTFIQWDTNDLDFFGLFVLNTTSWQPPIAGWYQVSGRGVFTANAVSRRGYFINTNGTTGAPGTVAGQSLQAPATGSAQISGQGLVYLNGTDFIGARVIQNSGAPLTIASTDGGSVLEAVYLGSPITA